MYFHQRRYVLSPKGYIMGPSTIWFVCLGIFFSSCLLWGFFWGVGCLLSFSGLLLVFDWFCFVLISGNTVPPITKSINHATEKQQVMES